MKNNFGIEKQLLTIGIPTYNRPEEIKKQVRLLLPQLDECVHLVVYDNCSDTPIKSYFTDNELSKFTLIRNKVNVGGDANIARCFENCTTKWLWTLSDDDFVREDAVLTILNEISNKKDALFICFWEKDAFETRDFKELAIKFKSASVYCDSFTMTRCLYNMSKLKYSLIDYYANISSMVGTMILVLKYVERNNTGTCFYSNKSIIENWNEDVGWSYERFIYRSFLFLDAFGTKYNKEYQKTLFIGLHSTNYSLMLLDRKSSGINHRQRLRLFKYIVSNQGFFNAIRYTSSGYLRVFIKLLAYYKIFSWIPNIIEKIIIVFRKKYI